MKKKLWSFVTVAAVTAGLVGCGSASSESTAQVSGVSSKSSVSGDASNSSGLEFYMVDPYVGYPYWDQVYTGAKEAAEYYGVKLNRVGPTEVNYDEQLKYMQTAIADGCDGIFTSALAPDTFAPVIEQSVSAKIPVVLIDSDAPDTDRTIYAGTSNYEAGKAAGKAMAEKLGGKGQVAVMVGAIDAQNMIDRDQGFRDAIAEYPDMEVVTTESTDNDLTKGVEKASSLILAYPDLKGVFGASGSDGIAAATVCQEQGKKQGDLTIIAMDDYDDTLEAIRNGWIYGTTVQNTYAMGWYGVMYLYEINKGMMSSEKQEGKDVIDTGVQIVTKDNIDTYSDQWEVNKVEP